MPKIISVHSLVVGSKKTGFTVSLRFYYDDGQVWEASKPFHRGILEKGWLHLFPVTVEPNKPAPVSSEVRVKVGDGPHDAAVRLENATNDPVALRLALAFWFDGDTFRSERPMPVDDALKEAERTLRRFNPEDTPK